MVQESNSLLRRLRLILGGGRKGVTIVVINGITYDFYGVEDRDIGEKGFNV